MMVPASGALQLVDGEALVAFDLRQQLALLDPVADPLADLSRDAGEARRHLHQRSPGWAAGCR